MDKRKIELNCLYKQGTNKLKLIKNEISVRLCGALNIYKNAGLTVARGQQ